MTKEAMQEKVNKFKKERDRDREAKIIFENLCAEIFKSTGSIVLTCGEVDELITLLCDGHFPVERKERGEDTSGIFAGDEGKIGDNRVQFTFRKYFVGDSEDCPYHVEWDFC
ncbi:MAG: hypothetical protein WCT49_02450 [Candidatus Paceibacterota bacterium]|jgi:hypothetical protein